MGQVQGSVLWLQPHHFCPCLLQTLSTTVPTRGHDHLSEAAPAQSVHLSGLRVPKAGVSLALSVWEAGSR